MHPFGDEVPAALQNHFSSGGQMDADVRTVDLFFDDERFVGDESAGILFVQTLVIGRPLRAEEMWGAGIFDEIIMRTTHGNLPALTLCRKLRMPIIDAD